MYKRQVPRRAVFDLAWVPPYANCTRRDYITNINFVHNLGYAPLEDVPQIEALVRSGKTEQRTAYRARILLAMHKDERVAPLSERIERDPSTIWRICRRYEERGIDAVYDAPRSGRPLRISPPHPDAD